MDVSLGDSGSWIVDLRMNIRPSSSTGVLFALVYNNIVPLSLAVVTRGDKHAVSSSRLSNTIDHFLTDKSTSTRVKLCSVVASSAPEPGSILGRCLCGDSGLYHVMLPWADGDAAKGHPLWNPILSQLLHCWLQVRLATGGPEAPQCYNAEPCQYIYRWDTR